MKSIVRLITAIETSRKEFRKWLVTYLPVNFKAFFASSKAALTSAVPLEVALSSTSRDVELWARRRARVVFPIHGINTAALGPKS